MTSLKVITYARDVSWNMIMAKPIRGGIAILAAWGKITNLKRSESDNPTELAASNWPLGTDCKLDLIISVA